MESVKAASDIVSNNSLSFHSVKPLFSSDISSLHLSLEVWRKLTLLSTINLASSTSLPKKRVSKELSTSAYHTILTDHRLAMQGEGPGSFRGTEFMMLCSLRIPLTRPAARQAHDGRGVQEALRVGSLILGHVVLAYERWEGCCGFNCCM